MQVEIWGDDSCCDFLPQPKKFYGYRYGSYDYDNNGNHEQLGYGDFISCPSRYRNMDFKFDEKYAVGKKPSLDEIIKSGTRADRCEGNQYITYIYDNRFFITSKCDDKQCEHKNQVVYLGEYRAKPFKIDTRATTDATIFC